MTEKSKTVFVVGRDSSVETLFRERGWDVLCGDPRGKNQIGYVDLTVFTGGSDIDPSWYGEENKGSFTSEYSRARDEFEFAVYDYLTEREIPKAGICRGGQLFNIRNGGSMVQDISGHEYGSHDVCLYDTQESVGRFNSCHHQMMVPTAEADMIAYSIFDGEYPCPEVIFYPKNRDLCFQAHPEWGHENTTDLFFKYIQICLGIKE